MLLKLLTSNRAELLKRCREKVALRFAPDEVPAVAQLDPIVGESKETTLDGLKSLNELNYNLVGDPETHTRIQQYGMYWPAPSPCIINVMGINPHQNCT